MRALLLSSTITLQGARQGECSRLQQVACRCQTACSCPLAALPKRQNPLATALEESGAPQDKASAEHKDSTYAMPHQMAAKPELEQSGAERQHCTRNRAPRHIEADEHLHGPERHACNEDGERDGWDQAHLGHRIGHCQHDLPDLHTGNTPQCNLQ